MITMFLHDDERRYVHRLCYEQTEKLLPALNAYREARMRSARKKLKSHTAEIRPHRNRFGAYSTNAGATAI